MLINKLLKKNMKGKVWASIFFVLSTAYLISCNQKNVDENRQDKVVADDKKNIDYLPLIISLDTLPSSSAREIILREDSLLSLTNGSEANPYYYYFKGRKYIYEKNKDSALVTYQKINSKGHNPDI